MNVTYYEYYPHYMGTTSAKANVDVITLLMAQELMVASVQDDDGFADDHLNDIIASIESENECTLFAFTNALTNDAFGDVDELKQGITKIRKELTARGFYAGEWEEGSFFFALPGYEQQARKALMKIEASKLDLGFDFDD